MVKYCLKLQCFDCYKYIETLLNPIYLIPEKREAAKNLIEYALNSQGGILKGDAKYLEKIIYNHCRWSQSFQKDVLKTNN